GGGPARDGLAPRPRPAHAVLVAALRRRGGPGRPPPGAGLPPPPGVGHHRGHPRDPRARTPAQPLPGQEPGRLRREAGAVTTPALTASELQATAATIAETQLPNGMIPWFPSGHADPWNHVEAAMALDTAGWWDEAERAYRWLGATQHDDGSWFQYYLAEGVENYRLDANCCAYVAVGAWHHYLVTGDAGFLKEQWPAVEAAIGFALRLQQPGGEILWCIEADGSPGRFALLTASSSVYFSLRCAVAAAEALGLERPEWEVALHAAGLTEGARRLLGWTRQLRHSDGSYWTGRVYPQEVNFPGGERSTYTAAAVILAAAALDGLGPAAGLFGGAGLPAGLD